MQPGLDTVQEFRIETAGSGAQYSRPATIDVVSRSGSNELHGALFETFRDNADGLIQPGILEYVTVYSRQPNTRANGGRRINITTAQNRQQLGQILQQRFGYVFESGGDGLYHALYDVQVIDGPFTAADAVAVTPIPLDHGIAPSLGFRFGDILYVNDLVRVPEDSFSLMDDAEVMIVDAMRYRPHPTHAHLDLALEWIERVAPKRAFLTNLHVDMDYAELDRRTPAHVHPCHDGLVIES